MPSLKNLLFVFAGLLLFLIGFSILMPSHVTVSKAIVINSAPSKVKNNISDLSKWEYWYPLIKNDTSVAGHSAMMENGTSTLLIKNKNREIRLSFISSDSNHIKIT